jgi:trimeric autotransporter adhesin
MGGPITVSPTSLTFTEIGVPQTVTVTNNGTVPVMLGPIAGSTTCGTILDAQSICTISVVMGDSSAAVVPE